MRYLIVAGRRCVTLAPSLLLLLFACSTYRINAADGSGIAFNSGDTTLRYYSVGRRSEVPLVVITGGPGFDHGYIRIGAPWDRIGKQRQVVFYDQRGTGRASTIAAGTKITVGDFIADIEALRAALGTERVAVLGHSWGGYLAMAYASRHADRVEKLIVVASAAPKLADTKFLFDAVFPENRERWRAWTSAMNRGDESFTNANADTYFRMLFHSPEKRDEWIHRAHAARLRFNPHLAPQLWSASAAPDVTDAVSNLDLPLLVIHGRHDMNVATETAFRTSSLARRGKLLIFERSGHLPFFEEPQRFAKEVLSFLR
mgnify:CR=1 FL=1